MNANIHFDNEAVGGTSYLVGSFSPDQPILAYQVGMLCSNEIPKLLKANKKQKNDDVMIYYNVTSRLALKQLMNRGKLHRGLFVKLLDGMVTALREVQEYQLPGSGLVFDEEYIFMETGSLEPAFVYLPIYNDETGLSNAKNFLQSLILKNVIETSDGNLVQLLLDALNSETLSLTTLENLVRELKRENRVSADADQRVRAAPAPVEREPEIAKLPPAALRESGKQPGREEMKTGTKSDAKSGTKKAAAKEGREPANRSKKNNIFALLQAGLFVGMAGLYASGMLNDKISGKLEIRYLAAMLLIVAAIDGIVFRRLFHNGPADQKQNRPTAKKTPKEKQDKFQSKKTPKGDPRRSAAEGRMAVAIPGRDQAMGIQTPNSVKPVPAPPVRVAPAPELKVPAAPTPDRKASTAAAPKSDRGDAADMWADTVIQEVDETGEIYLEYYENGILSKVRLDKPSILVGRLASQVDFAINNVKVGKIHAEFICDDGRISVKDLNSKNGTYVNGGGRRITANVPYPLQNGDKIVLADSEFILRC